jgi:hypothetical protein
MLLSGLTHRYRNYKFMLRTLLVLNALMVSVGGVLFFEYLRTHDVAARDLFLIGLGTLIIGFILPYLIWRRVSHTLHEIKVQTEKAVAHWVAGWLESLKESPEDPFRDPRFWANIGLLSAEVLCENSHHPVVRTLGELAPMIKRELRKQHPSTKHKRTA